MWSDDVADRAVAATATVSGDMLFTLSTEYDSMGLFWDLYQQSQISQQSERTATTEMRLDHLEQEVARLSTLLRAVIGRLEQHVGVDLDQDGRVG